MDDEPTNVSRTCLNLGPHDRPSSVTEWRSSLERAVELLKGEDDPDLYPLHEILEEQLRDIETATAALCVRLGVAPDLPELHRWALIGAALALREPEYNKPKPRGRPKKSESLAKKQAGLVDLGKKMFPGITDRKIIEALKALPNKHPDIARLLAADTSSLLARVSEGRRLTK